MLKGLVGGWVGSMTITMWFCVVLFTCIHVGGASKELVTNVVKVREGMVDDGYTKIKGG